MHTMVDVKDSFFIVQYARISAHKGSKSAHITIAHSNADCHPTNSLQVKYIIILSINYYNIFISWQASMMFIRNH